LGELYIIGEMFDQAEFPQCGYFCSLHKR
jgi:hypothetical protein